MKPECKCETRNKRLIVCCDGTWQTSSQPYPTNVLKLSQAIKPVAEDGTQQIVYYSPGLGTRGGLDNIMGLFGYGLDQEIKDAYTFLVLNYQKGDEVYLFGFSRGAYIIRSLAGFIYCSGLLERSNLNKRLFAFEKDQFIEEATQDEKKEFERIYSKNTFEGKEEGILDTAYEIYRSTIINEEGNLTKNFRGRTGIGNSKDNRISINFLGCWDTVATLGYPGKDFVARNFNKMLNFHNYKLCSEIKHARHAIALDEVRKSFDIRLMQTDEENVLKQVWFPGDHGCVGGGCKNQALSQATLLWMIEEIRLLREDTTITDANLDIDKNFISLDQCSASNLDLKNIEPEYRRNFLWMLTYFMGSKERSSRFISSLNFNDSQSKKFSEFRHKFQALPFQAPLELSWQSFSKALESALELLLSSIRQWLSSTQKWLVNEYPKIAPSIQRNIGQQLEEVVRPKPPQPFPAEGFSSAECLAESIEIAIGINENAPPSDRGTSSEAITKCK